MKQASTSLEALKLKLIRDNTKSHPDFDPLLTTDGIRYLLKALAYADADFSAEIENVLVNAGALALPELLKALDTDNANVRSVSAMVLIRMGPLAEEALLRMYPKYSRKASVRWVLQFILQELGLDLPHAAEPAFAMPTLIKVG